MDQIFYGFILKYKDSRYHRQNYAKIEHGDPWGTWFQAIIMNLLKLYFQYFIQIIWIPTFDSHLKYHMILFQSVRKIHPREDARITSKRFRYESGANMILFSFPSKGLVICNLIQFFHNSDKIRMFINFCILDRTNMSKCNVYEYFKKSRITILDIEDESSIEKYLKNKIHDKTNYSHRNLMRTECDIMSFVIDYRSIISNPMRQFDLIKKINVCMNERSCAKGEIVSRHRYLEADFILLR